MHKCQNRVEVPTRRGETVKIVCGTWYSGEKWLCRRCERRVKRAFPQGWRYYPGDVCKHGTYVGGCGVDYMCGACEAGY